MAQFSINTRVFFGKNAQDEARAFLKNASIKKLGFIVDQNISRLSSITTLISGFEENGFSVECVKSFDASHEPTYNLLDDFTERFRGVTIDALVAVGGGSVMDVSKGVGILLKNPGKGIEYRGMDKVKVPGIPVICYPTTAGTGSEVTHTASFIDAHSMTKLGINGRYVAPMFGVLVPELAFACPPQVTIYAGLDAMVHALEAVTARTATSITKALGSLGFSKLYTHFRKAVCEPQNYEAREGMLLGSYLAGIAMMNTGGGPASGISYPLGVHYHVPHGIAGGIFLLHVVAFNVGKGYTGYADVYNHLPDASPGLSEERKARDFVRKFEVLYNDLGAPKDLSPFHVGKAEIEYLTQLTMEQRKENLDLNPVHFGKEDVEKLLRKVVK